MLRPNIGQASDPVARYILVEIKTLLEQVLEIASGIAMLSALFDIALKVAPEHQPMIFQEDSRAGKESSQTSVVAVKSARDTDPST
jgi:hypothetical protein